MQHGGVIAYSTETVLGLGCDPYNESAINKLLWLKNRAFEKGLIVLADNYETLERYSLSLSKEQKTKISVSENTTWLVPANEKTPTWLTGEHEKIAVRISEHLIAGQLAAKMSGVVSTSANLSTYKILASYEEVRNWFGPHVDYILLGKPGTSIPSTICDLLSGEIIRSN